MQCQVKKTNMIKKPLYLYIFSILLFMAYGCSNTRYLPEGEMLYVGGEVKVEDSVLPKGDRKAFQKELEGLLRPKPNSAFLGLRFKLYIYNLAGEPKKEKGLKYWLRNKVGEPPVLFSKVDLDYNADLLQNYSENKGYFKTRTSADSTSSNRRAKAMYTLTPGPRYTIREVKFPSDTLSTPLDTTIASIKRRSRLRKGNPYDLDVIKEERVRIDERLKEKGYYFFNPDYILVQVDSTIGKNQVDLIVKIKDETPERAKKVYTINNIYIYPNFSLSANINNDSVAIPVDSVQRYKDYTIIDPENTFKPKIYDRTLYFHKGDIYNRKDHNLSLNRLVNLGTFKFVKNSFKVSDSLDTALDAYYYLTPLARKSLRFEILGKTNSANYNGSEVNVNWSNRNTFRAAELLTITAFGGVEVQVSGQNNGFNIYRVGTEASLVWPRIISPFRIESSSAFVPRTRALLGYEYQNRSQLYSLNSLKGSFGYLWKENVRKEHQLNLTDITYVSPTNVTDLYMDRIREEKEANGTSALERIIERQLIFGPSYTYTYTNTMRRFKKNTFYYKANLDVAGTIAGLASGSDIKAGDTTKVFNVPFSQFVKTEQDIRHYLRLGRESQLASRIIAGVGIPYGNSDQLPFIRQFFVGGTNSVRAFRARSIGPGTFREEVATSSFLPDQAGDFKLELNTEYRAKLYSVIHGALFIDAGNIWLLNENQDKPGGQLSKNFYKELAVGTGAGLRFDLSFLVLRLDLAFPIRKPYLPENNRWVLDEINFGSSGWRKENLVFNIAIGYPF